MPFVLLCVGAKEEYMWELCDPGRSRFTTREARRYSMAEDRELLRWALNVELVMLIGGYRR